MPTVNELLMSLTYVQGVVSEDEDTLEMVKTAMSNEKLVASLSQVCVVLATTLAQTFDIPADTPKGDLTEEEKVIAVLDYLRSIYVYP